MSTFHLGNEYFWPDRPAALSSEELRQHVYAIGQTGAGKSTLLRNLILQLIHQGEGVGLIDPHGDLALELLQHIPRSRTKDVVWIDAGDVEHPIGMNVLRAGQGQRSDLVASGVVAAMKSIWRDSWGPRLEYILYAAVAALLECDNVSLLGVPRLLTDSRYRAWVMGRVTDPYVRSFWMREFASWDARFVAEAISPVQNKVGQLLMAGPLRNVLGQVRNRIDFRRVIDERQILLVNLSKGQMGEDKSNLLGSLLVNQLQLAAMGRSNVPERQRVPFTLCVDEFHNFSTDRFASSLSESRKYGLSLVLAHQYTSQLDDEVRDAVFGNVGSMLALRVGASDAHVLARQFGDALGADEFTTLPARQAIVHRRGEHRPTRITLHPPMGILRNGRDPQPLIDRSRQQFSTPRPIVEGRIVRWLEQGGGMRPDRRRGNF